MKYQIRQSDDETFYYLISIDEENNETVLISSPELSEIHKHKSLKGSKPEPIKEKDTRNTVSSE